MQKRALGTTGIQIAPLMFGGNVFGWTADEATSFDLLDAFVERGFDFIDTADVYSGWAHDGVGGQSETIIGKWLKQSGKRDRIVLATKVGKAMGPDQIGLSAAYIGRAVEASLTRLQTDYIDLYQSHDDDQKTPFEETLGAYDTLIRAGKVRFIGASNYSAPRLENALTVAKDAGLPAYATLQPLFNLYDRADYEGALEACCLRHGLGVVPFYSLAAGFLTGKYASIDDIAGSPRQFRLKGYFDERGMRILATVRDIAATIGAEPASVALAWLMARPGITAPIASATSLAQLDTLLEAADLTLSAEDIARLDQAGAM
jgi:aryl-alcohol dehydrogenase-like predicted oxidoreductase